MAYFVRMEKPVAPAALGIKCSAGGLTILALGIAKKSDGKSVPYACPLFAECTAQTTRTNGCFDVELDVCVTQDGVARINKVTGTSIAVEFDFKTPAKVSARSRELERLAKESKH